MKTIICCLLAYFTGFFHVFAQSGDSQPWTFISETALEGNRQQRQIIPMSYQTIQLDVEQMKSILADAPMWQTSAARTKAVILTIPMPDGSFQDFRIMEAPVMHPDLAARFPMIKSYAGTGIDDPLANIRFDMTPQGFHAMIRTPNQSTIYIDPYSAGDDEHYISYHRKDLKRTLPFGCQTQIPDGIIENESAQSLARAGDCQLRIYRMALACTGEYATYHGGTVVLALAAMVTTMTRVNGIYENEASIHMQLVANNDQLIFLNAATDPYSNSNGGAMLGQNQTTCDNIIGSANYDIGHVFSTGGGGVAYLAVVCEAGFKAGGVTGLPDPVGNPFDVDYVSHEIGHQFGANHTQNNGCQRNGPTAMEPGSASTIMGYAGICNPNVQSNSDDYFHAISLQEMGNFVSGMSHTCPVRSTINGAPTADAGQDYTIPMMTPFVLTGTGSDPDNDVITYNWEQMNNNVATMPPLATNTIGPAFRSSPALVSPSRYLPNLADLVNNISPTWEVLASVSRTYNWRLTVRDNHPGGGCTAEDNMIVSVTNTSGPFIVTSPNTAVDWAGLSSQTVTWDVANTNAAPVSCANVDIFLSLDGGFTYPITLASSTPNDGSHTVTIPNNPTTQARIMVKGNGNIFFDISNQNFTISLGNDPCDDAISIIDVSSTSESCPNANDGSITISAVSSNSAVSYDITGPSNQSNNTGIFTNLPDGTYTVSVTDELNCEETTLVIVVEGVDNTFPTINCPGAQEIYLVAEINPAEGCSVELPDYSNSADVFDECGVASVVQIPVPGTMYSSEDSLSVTLIVTDINSNTSSCSFVVEIIDNMPPLVTCADMTINIESADTIILNHMELVSALDNCEIDEIILSPALITCEQVGQTIAVNVSVTDLGGNTSNCSAQVTVTGLPCGWIQHPDGIGCIGGNSLAYNQETETFTLTSTNCYYGSPFNNDAMAFAQQTLCGNGSLTVEVTGISGLGWAGVIMRESNAPGAKKVQLSTNMNSFLHRREVRTITNGPAFPLQFPSQNRFWLRLVRSGNQFVAYSSPNGMQWFQVMAANVPMNNCIEAGLILSNYSQNSTVNATFNNVNLIGNNLPLPSITNDLAVDGFYGITPDFEVYPNPTSGELFVDLLYYAGKSISIEIYNIHGQAIQSIDIEKVVLDNKGFLNLWGYAPGLYFVKLKSLGLPDVTKKVILQGQYLRH